jgi:hypothetical protein
LGSGKSDARDAHAHDAHTTRRAILAREKSTRQDERSESQIRGERGDRAMVCVCMCGTLCNASEVRWTNPQPSNTDDKMAFASLRHSGPTNPILAPFAPPHLVGDISRLPHLPSRTGVTPRSGAEAAAGAALSSSLGGGLGVRLGEADMIERRGEKGGAVKQVGASTIVGKKPCSKTRANREKKPRGDATDPNRGGRRVGEKNHQFESIHPAQICLQDYDV